MDDRGKSDGRVVPVSPPNKAVSAAAEVVEGRRPAKGNAASESRAGLSAGSGVSSDLDRVRQVASPNVFSRSTESKNAESKNDNRRQRSQPCSSRASYDLMSTATTRVCSDDVVRS